jgi:hypothetical protein
VVFVGDTKKIVQELGPATPIYLVESVDDDEVLWGWCLQICEPSRFGVRVTLRGLLALIHFTYTLGIK